MKRKKLTFWLCVMAFIITGCCMSMRQKYDNLTRYDVPAMQHQYETVALVTSVQNTWKPYCAGVWVSPTTIVTAAHCLESDEEEDPNIPDNIKELLKLINKSDFPTPLGTKVSYLIYDDVGTSMDVSTKTNVRFGTVVAYEPNDDLALIEAESDSIPPDHPVAKVSRDKIADGEEATVVGHPVGYWWTISNALISHTRVIEHPNNSGPGTKMLHINGNVWFGISGGGAFNSDGCLVGISSKIDANGPGLAFLVHRDLIWELLVKNNVTVDDRRRP